MKLLQVNAFVICTSGRKMCNSGNSNLELIVSRSDVDDLLRSYYMSRNDR